MSILQGILSFENDFSNCIVFNKAIVLAPAYILDSYIRSSDSVETMDSLQKTNTIFLPKENMLHVKFTDKKNAPLRVCEAHLFTSIYCAEVHDLVVALFNDSFDEIAMLLKSHFLVLQISGFDESSVKKTLLNFESRSKLKILDDVLTVSTPFNEESFHGTVHNAKVANVKKDTLFVLSSCLPFGCEGCPVFDRKL